MSGRFGGHRGTGQQPGRHHAGEATSETAGADRGRGERATAPGAARQDRVGRLAPRANAKIARDLRICVDTVRRWRARFRRAGMPGLRDRPRSGRPPVYGIEDQLRIVATVTQAPPQIDAQWTHRGLAEQLAEPVGISASQIGRILASCDVKPHRVRGWLNRPADPAFHTKAQAVCRLYLQPPAADTVLFSVDEKTAMQARSRKRATRPVRPGRVERREFEYVRHGTVSLMAAMNVTTGTIHPKICECRC